jgi:hypothetical protein
MSLFKDGDRVRTLIDCPEIRKGELGTVARTPSGYGAVRVSFKTKQFQADPNGRGNSVVYWHNEIEHA